MSAIAQSLIVFLCISGCALIGFYVRRALPEHHLGSDSLLAVSLTTGLAATLASLVLGLMVSSTHSSFSKLNDEVAQTAAQTIFLDRMLIQYGSEASESRRLLSRAHTAAVDYLHQVRSKNGILSDDSVRQAGLESFLSSLRQLKPKNDEQRQLKAYVVDQGWRLAETRWLIAEQNRSSIPQIFFIALVAWLAFIFLGFGLITENNATVLCSLLGGALLATSAIFVILEMDSPLDGVVTVSIAPMENASAILGRAP
ncbi:MAG: conserved rane protein of unknown function [Proteobacteria bacterium]|nr:conserved rane protein of unknown function [Pseudomonadota bacterium]